MTALSDAAGAFQDRLTAHSDRVARRVVRLWRQVAPTSLDAGWDAVAPQIYQVMTAGQAEAAVAGGAYAARTLNAQGATESARIVPQAFAGVTREGREVVPELFAAVTTTKTLISRGSGVPAAFQAGAGVMSLLASTIIRDTGRSAAGTVAVGKGARYSVRVVQAGACSRCAILAGVVGYRENFQRHPGCRCTSMWLTEGEAPEGFFASTADYFDSLSEAEQDRVFTKSGAWAIRNGADPTKVVNARRGAYKVSPLRADGTYANARLRPITIGKRPDGSPLQVYATVEGTTARGAWGRSQRLDVKGSGDRYRRTSTLRLMPESIMSMSENANPERVRELLQRYGYLY